MKFYIFIHIYHHPQIKRLQLSFRTAKELRGRAEILPSGPEWRCKPLTAAYPTKKSISLFYRDPIACVQSLLHSPLAQDYIHFIPIRIFKTAEKLMRVYTEWRTGMVAWEIQVCATGGLNRLTNLTPTLEPITTRCNPSWDHLILGQD